MSEFAEKETDGLWERRDWQMESQGDKRPAQLADDVTPSILALEKSTCLALVYTWGKRTVLGILPRFSDW